MYDAIRSVIDEAATEPGKLGDFLSAVSPDERTDLVAEVANVTCAFVDVSLGVQGGVVTHEAVDAIFIGEVRNPRVKPA